MRRPLLLALLALALLPAGASAAGPPAPPMSLPPAGVGDVTGALGGTAPVRGWLVGALDDPAVDALAARHGARRLLAEAAVFRLRPSRARAFAAALRSRGLLAFAEPDRVGARRAFPQDPLSGQQQLGAVLGGTDLTPPAIGPASPQIAVLDAQVAAHPEWTGGNLRLLDPARPVTEAHGTEVASVAGAPANGQGIVGVLPGARLLGIDTPTTCSGSVAAIRAAVAQRASVLNMSYGGGFCYSEYVATQLAARAGAVLVAAGGNEFLDGNQPEYPASYAHVVTVASVDRGGASSYFSNENEGIDLSAPGEDILAAVPPALDADGTPDGYALVSGTSFAAPQVSAAAAWVRAVRPALLPDQVASVLRRGARDLGDRGWDRATGYGLLQVRSALGARPDPAERSEPNDDIGFVNGTFGRRRASVLGSRAHSRSRSGLLDQWEDPSDVQRLVLAGGRSVRVTVQTRFGDADVAVYSSSARTVDSRRGLVARSLRGGRARDSVVVSNRSSRSRSFYVAVYVDAAVDQLDAGYRLTITRR